MSYNDSCPECPVTVESSSGVVAVLELLRNNGLLYSLLNVP
jgi:hypothetical protein